MASILPESLSSLLDHLNQEFQAQLVIAVVVICGLYIWRTRLHEKSSTNRSSSKSIATPARTEDEKPRSKFYGNEDTITSLDFSSVTPYQSPHSDSSSSSFVLANEPPHPFYRHSHIANKIYTPTMGITSLQFDDWILLDSNYPSRMALKSSVIASAGPQVITCLPPGFEACVEHLEMLVEYLPRRFPSVFTLNSVEGGREIVNHATGERFDLRPGRYEKSEATRPNHPLYIAGRLIEDDVAFLTLPHGSDEYVLQAAFFGFPSGFLISDKMGLRLSDIHGPVPLYQTKLKPSMNKFFANVGPSRMVERLNWSVNEKDQLFLPEGGHFYEGQGEAAAELEAGIDIDKCVLRIERQVLRRLPKTKALVFLVKTYMYPITEIAKEPGFAEKLGGLLHKLPEKFSFYKRKPVWGKVICAYLDEMAKQYPEVEVGGD